MRSLAAGLLFLACGCSTSSLPINCEARCMGPSGRPPTSVACVANDPGKCLTPTGGLQPRCEDGTLISIALCQDDGHAKCKNGASPACVQP